MKALTIKEPWASMIYIGQKTIETRTWNTKYRGLLVLTASRKPKSFLSGKAFAVVYLSDCRHMTEEDEQEAYCKVYPKAHSLVFSDIFPMINPQPCKGQLGIFNTEIHIGICKKCGCTDERACPGGCHWVAPNLCSRCEG